MEKRWITSRKNLATIASHYKELEIDEIFGHKQGIRVEELKDWQENSLVLSTDKAAEDFNEFDAELTEGNRILLFNKYQIFLNWEW